VVFAEKQRSRRAHSLKIERPRFLMRVTTPERWRNRSVHHTINVCLAGGRITRVKIAWDKVDEQDPNVSRQVAIDRVSQLERTYLSSEIRIRHLALGMHARVGSA